MSSFRSQQQHWSPMGQMLLEYQRGSYDTSCVIRSSIEPDRLTWASHYFREQGFTKLENKAVAACRGRVLDVGAGAGSHSLLLQAKNFNVTALEISPEACECMTLRGVQKVENIDFFSFTPEKKFDTLFMMMNGIGFIGYPERFADFFQHARQVLNEKGVILCDSTDLSYVEKWSRESASLGQPEGSSYYGCVSYQMVYEGREGGIYPWLFADMKMLTKAAEENGFSFKVMHRQDKHHFLVQLARR